MGTTELSTTGNARPGGPHIPFAERPVCSIADAAEATGLSRSKLYDLMKNGLIEWTKVGSRRLVVVPSLLRFLAS
jgi:excisionase family DNA binding protein